MRHMRTAGGNQQRRRTAVLVASPDTRGDEVAFLRDMKCDFCKECYAWATAMQIDCYNPSVRAQKERMLQAK